MSLNIIDQLVHTTVRIECYSADGKSSCGTGFFFGFCPHGEDRAVPAIVTNKHVIKDATFGILRMNIRGPDGMPIYGQHVEVPIHQFEESWVKHPDAGIDLAALPMADIHRWLKKQGKEPFYVALDHDSFASDKYLLELTAIEDLVLIGYPNGLWDKANNLPLVRRGITATAPYIDLDGRSEFMIDCACFPGSSGSPILLYNIGSYIKKSGGMQLGARRVKLLGVLHSGPQYTAEGKIEVRPVPTAMQLVALSGIPSNLGYCVKASQLLAFEERFKKFIHPDDVGLTAAS